MDRTERFYRIDQLLHERKSVPVNVFLEELEISLSTFKRDLAYMKDRFHAPIEWNRDLRGYEFVQKNGRSPSYALPGLWLNEGEIHALLSMQHLLANLQPGILESQIELLRARLRALLGSGDQSAEEVERRFRIIYAARRRVIPKCFQSIATALLRRRRLKLKHFRRESGEVIEREVSPQRLMYYRENWYLRTWCHLRNDLRSFALDAVQSAEPVKVAAREVLKKVLEQAMESGYGIFGGATVTRAKLRFSPERARWVSAEEWHPHQCQHKDDRGFLVLEVPYSDDRELLMDILKLGHHVKVLEPAGLRKRVEAELHKAFAGYETA